jgi:putative ABC transport system permease protein
VTSGFSVDTFRVTGVLKPVTRKSHVNADFYMTMNSEGWGDLINGMTTWSGQNFMFTYIKLKKGTDDQALVSKFAPWIEKHGGDEMRAMGRTKTLGLQRLKDVHLHSNHFAFNLDLAPTGSIWYIYVMGSVAIFILLLGCINFMNLTTARAAQRAGEVGVRKTMGAGQPELIRQFMGESLIVVFIAILVSVGLVQMVLPFFNSMATRSLSVAGENLFFYFTALVIIGLLTALISGSYPSFFLAAFKPVSVLKNKNVLNASSSWLRKGLVVVQFVISITLIGASIIIYQQLSYVQNQNLGFSVDHRIMIPIRTAEAKNEYAILKTEFEKVPGVKKVSASTSLPFTPLLRDVRLHRAGGNMDNSEHHLICNIDENYFELLDIPLIAGRLLDRVTDRQTDNVSRIIVNRTSVRKLGIVEDEAPGQKLFWTGRLNGAQESTTLVFEIVGVVDDFHQHSLHSGIEPIIFFLPETTNNYVFMAVAIDPGTFKQVTSRFENIWKQHVPGTPFETQFLSEEIRRKYDHDNQISLVISLFTSIAIAISCLGLYGLSVFVTQRRMKEIGVRKVLGASGFSIVRMLSVEFIVLVAIAFLIALPLGFYAMEEWLHNFAYRIDLGLENFLLAGVISFVIAWLTVSVEALQAAASNPVNSLRND